MFKYHTKFRWKEADMKAIGKKETKVIVEKIKLWLDHGWTIKYKTETFGGTKIFVTCLPDD